ncbi:MAG: protein-L-isoaspartate O-methyltransferase [Rhizobiales bacterium]|nr:protein-L-isoaspartate O-methyltransferase [Hyphomicrobiales bacterium]
MLNFVAAREAMVESQVRPNGITDRRIIDAMASIAREDFVPEACKAVAYMDEDIPLNTGPVPRYLIEAMAFARLVQLAEIKPTDKVLHVGVATGYGAAVLARLAMDVTAVESDAALAAQARHNLRSIANVSIVEGPLAEGAKSRGPFDVIVVEGRVGEMPQSLIDQASDGGRIVAVLGEGDVAKAQLWVIHGKTTARRPAFDATVAALPGFERRRAPFIFEGFNEVAVS